MSLAKRIGTIGMAVVAAVGPVASAAVPVAVVAAPVVVVSQVVDANTQKAEAVDWNRPSRLYNNTGSYWIKMYPVPRATNYPTNYSRPGSVFYMDCWQYGQSFAGNYLSTKWFYGYNGSWGYIHSSYVYNQITVPPC